MYAADHNKRQRRVTLHHSSRAPDSQAACPAGYRHLYQVRRFNGDIIAQVIIAVFYLLHCCSRCVVLG